MSQVQCDVCIVGAGYAGLAAARRLTQQNRDVIVLEARDRVGGRVWTRYLDDGSALDMGGTWLGPGQDAAYTLARDLDVSTYPTYAQGDTVFINARGERSTYRGSIPKIGIVPVASLGQGMLRLDRLARQVQLDAPAASRQAAGWDRQTIGGWINAQVPTATAQHLLRAAVRGLLTADPDEISLLHFLYLVRSAGGLNALLSIEGGYQQDRLSGGAQTMALKAADELGGRVRLQSPVREVTQDAAGVTVRADGIEVAAKRVIVTAPPALATRIRYTPALPTDRAQLLDRMPAGALIKVLAVYDDAFWRADGLSANSVVMNSPIETTLDASPASGRPGILAAFAFGPHALRLAAMADSDRRGFVLAALQRSFGPRAATPIAYEEQDWAREEWTRGCSTAHFAPGILSQYGDVLRRPVGRIHWAGTETATVSHGAIDGAIRSGYRAADEVLRSVNAP